MDPQHISMIPTAMVFLFVLITVAVIGFRVMRTSSKASAVNSVPTVPAGTPENSSPSAPVKRPENRNPFWPEIHDRATARFAARQAMIAAFFCAAATGLVSFLAYAGLPLAPGTAGRALLDAVIFAALGIGIARMSRTAAILTLALYVCERAYSCVRVGVPGVLASIVMLVIVLCFINGVRGTSANDRLEAPLIEPEPPVPADPIAAIHAVPVDPEPAPPSGPLP